MSSNKEAAKSKETTTELVKTTQELIKNNKQKHNYKLTKEDIKEIMLFYYLDNRKNTIQDICNKYGISTRRYYQIVKDKKNVELINRDITDMKRNFTKKSELIIDKALNKINESIEEGTTSPRDLITITGILYDKTRLENNLSTSNNSININIKVEK